MSKPDAYKSPTLTNFRILKQQIGGPVKVSMPKQTIAGYTPTHRTGGPTWNEGLKAGTPVQPTNNKGDGKDIGRGKVITY